MNCEITNEEWFHFREMIKDEPTIEVPQRMRGKWVKENMVLTSNPPQYQWHCSECGKTMYGYSAEILTDFCPNCGADMRRGQDETRGVSETT